MPVKPNKNTALKTTGVAKQTIASRRQSVVATGLRRRGFTPYWLEFMAENDIDFLEAYERIYELTAVRKSVLPAKFREMIVVAAVAIGGYQSGLKQHVHRALQLGATKQELIEVFQSAYFHTGALTLVQGMIALIDCLNELEEEGARAKKEAVAKKAIVKKEMAKKEKAKVATVKKATAKKNVASVKNPTTKRVTKRAAT
jgi:alkylhydroperoxidase/carboxymuconolactone decarboxylase family protein YurZ